MRVFGLPKGEKLYSFRRGIHKAEVYCLGFNIRSNVVLLSSNSGTIHLFKLDSEHAAAEEHVSPK